MIKFRNVIIFFLAIGTIYFMLPKNFPVKSKEVVIKEIYHIEEENGATYHTKAIAPVVFNNQVRYIIDFDISCWIDKYLTENGITFYKEELFKKAIADSYLELDNSTFECNKNRKKSTESCYFYDVKFRLIDNGEKSDYIQFDFSWDISED